ncbi:MAG: 5'/3'-nucleotidase SurE [Gammaproteobacteria bacterium]|nr:5'/3'-nucleotidase SurE [Gammaproteobacteria bacterium]
MSLKILLANDDGYLAPGIVTLHKVLQKFGQVDVVAPHKNNSAKSNSLTILNPLYVRKADNGFYFINGTPADCVHIALTGLIADKPDLVISGINNGANMGDDTIYSGTVGAAMEGYLMGIPAIAVSQVDKGWLYLEDAAQKMGELLKHIIEHGWLQNKPVHPWLFNVNIPNLPLEQLGKFEVCRLGRRHIAQKIIKQVNPFGDTMYWIGQAGGAKDADIGTDFYATTMGNISITPLQIDLTDYHQLENWKSGFNLS